MRKLADVEEWNHVLESSGARPVVLLKHSTRCPVSAAAYDQFLKHIDQDGSLKADYALVLVVEHRSVSNAVSEDLGVKHESPQVLIIRNGQPVWHASHWRITAEALKEQVAGIS